MNSEPNELVSVLENRVFLSCRHMQVLDDSETLCQNHSVLQ